MSIEQSLRDMYYVGVYNGGVIILKDKKTGTEYHITVCDLKELGDLELIERLRKPSVKIKALFDNDEIVAIQLPEGDNNTLALLGLIKVNMLDRVLMCIIYRSGMFSSGKYCVEIPSLSRKINLVLKDETLKSLLNGLLNGNLMIAGEVNSKLTKLKVNNLEIDLTSERSKTYFCTLSKGSYNDSVTININYMDGNITKEVVIKGLDEEAIKRLINQCDTYRMHNQVSVQLRDNKAVKLFVGKNIEYDIKEVSKNKIEEKEEMSLNPNRDVEVEIVDVSKDDYITLRLKDSDAIRNIRFNRLHDQTMSSIRFHRQIDPNLKYKVRLVDDVIKFIEIKSSISPLGTCFTVEEVSAVEKPGEAFRSVVKEFVDMIEDMINEDEGLNTITGKPEKVCDGVYILRDDKTSILLTNTFRSPRYDSNLSYLIKTKQDIKIEYVGDRDAVAKLYSDAIKILTPITVLNKTEYHTDKVYAKEGKVYLDNGVETYQLEIGDGTKEASKMLSDILPTTSEDVLIFETGKDVLAVYVPNYTLFQVLNYKTKEASASEISKSALEDYNVIEEVTMFCNVGKVGCNLEHFILEHKGNKYLVNSAGNDMIKHLLSKTDTVKCNCSVLNGEISATISTPHVSVNNVELIKITGEIATGNIITSDSSNYMFIKDNEKGHYLLQHNENPNRYYKTNLVKDKQVVTLITVTENGEEQLVLIDNSELFTYLKAKLHKPNFMKGDLISLAPGKFKDMKTGDEYFVRKPMMISNILGSHYVAYQLVNKDTYFLTHPKLNYGIEVELHKVPTFDATMVCKTPDTNLIANIRKDLNELLFKLLYITDLDKVNMILDQHNELHKCNEWFNAHKAMGGFNNYNPHLSGDCRVGKTSDGMKEDKNFDFSSSWHVTGFNPYLDGVAHSGFVSPGLKFDSPSGLEVREGDVTVPNYDSYCGNYREMTSEQLIKTGSEVFNEMARGGCAYVEGTLNPALRNQAAMDKGHGVTQFVHKPLLHDMTQEAYNKLVSDITNGKDEGISNISKELMEALNSKKSLVPLIPKREVKTKGYIHVDMDNDGVYKINEVSLVQPYAEHSHIGEPLFVLDMSQVEPHNVNSSFPNMYSILITIVKEKTNRVDFEDSDLIFSLNAVNALVKFDFKFKPIIKERHFVSIGISRGRLQPSCSVITYLNPKAFEKLSVLQPGDKNYEVYKAFLLSKMPEYETLDTVIIYNPNDPIKPIDLAVCKLVNSKGNVSILDTSRATTIYKLFGNTIKERNTIFKMLKKDINGNVSTNDEVYFTKGFVDRHKGIKFIKIDK